MEDGLSLTNGINIILQLGMKFVMLEVEFQEMFTTCSHIMIQIGMMTLITSDLSLKMALKTQD